MPTLRRTLAFSWLVWLWPCLAAAQIALTAEMHHLRSGAEREWADFPERPEAAALTLGFDAAPDERESTLRVRHRDLKQPWRILLNGREIGRLPLDEADMVTFWSVPAGALAHGRNEIRIESTGTASDDVMIGQVTLIHRSRGDLLSEASVVLTVTEEPGGRATPARITVVDGNGSLATLGNRSDARHAVRPGVVYSLDGTVRLALPAGRYVVHAGRGFEYSVASAELDLLPGSAASRQLAIRRQVDTVGWAAMDTHLHTGTFARHGDATVAERMLTIAGERVELPVSTEHNTLVDFEAHAREAGVRGHFTPLVGSEVTTPSLGHFNVFPVPAGTAIDQRAPDWTALHEQFRSIGTDPAIVLNHGRDVHGGFRPLDPARHVSVAGEDLEGRRLPANAMEVVNSGAVMTDGLALVSDWMGMLNRGLLLTPVGSSDAHDVSRYIVGQARTYVWCADSDPARIDPGQAMASLRRGRVLVSYGLLAEIDVAGQGPGELAAGGAEHVEVRVRVQGPAWTEADRVMLYMNGAVVREEAIADGTKSGVKWEGTWRVPRPPHDVHLVAVATGPGVSAPYWPTAKPYQPTSIAFTPYVLGVSGAVFVDADGTGTFEPALVYARREVAAAQDHRRLTERLAMYDGAVAIQAASLLRGRNPAAFEEELRSMIEAAAPHVADALRRYLGGWKASEARRAGVDARE